MKTWSGMAAPHPYEPEFLSWVREQLVGLTEPGPPILRWCRIDPSGPGLHAPKRDGDIGWDLEAATTITIGPGGHEDIPANVRVQLPENCWGEVRARSCIARRGLIAMGTVIDNGYSGPLFALIHNTLGHPITVTKGDRMAQLVVHQGAWCVGEEVDDIPDDPRRGSAGFGSTGC